MRSCKSMLAAAAVAAVAFSPIPALADAETKEPVKILFINSSDGDFISAVYGEVLKETGYRVKYVQADYAAGYTAVETGDIDASLQAWQTTGVDLTKKVVDSGKVENYGPTGVKVSEGWWYTTELKAACPGLPKWEALKEEACIKALVVADTAPKGRYVDAPADWSTGAADRIKELSLNLTAVNSGSPAALVASIKGALDRKEPSLSWGFLPHWLLNANTGGFVELPGFKPNVDVLKLVNKAAFAKIPKAAAILKAFTLSADVVAVAMDTQDNGGKTAEQAAHDWMAKNEATWKTWLPK